MEIKDSGERRSFDSGAVRDVTEGKGRFDLLPPNAIRRLALHYQNGAKKYGDRNWEKGIPVSNYLDSGLRHLFSYLAGAKDEDHLVAGAWNVMCAMETEIVHPDLQDIPAHLETNAQGKYANYSKVELIAHVKCLEHHLTRLKATLETQHDNYIC